MEQTTTEIDALKQEVEELKVLTEDTNRQVHKMRRSARWGLLFQILWWLSVIGVTGAAYYYYVQPYIQKVEEFYLEAQQGAPQAQNWQQQLGQWFGQYFSGANSTGQQTTQ